MLQPCLQINNIGCWQQSTLDALGPLKPYNMLKSIINGTLKVFCFTFLGLTCLFCIIYLPRLSNSPHSSSASFNNTDFVTIILSAVGVILTALTIVLAIAAVAGYVTIRDAIQSSSKDIAERIAREITKTEMVEVRSIAARVAEEIASQKIGEQKQFGDDIALASSGGNAQGTSEG